MLNAKFNFWLLLGGLCFAAFSVTNVACADDETKVTLKQVPKAVRKAIKLASKNAEIEKIVLEVEDGNVQYEVEMDVDGGSVELCFNADGQLIEIGVVDSKDKGADEMESDEDGQEASEESGETTAIVELKDIPEAARIAIQKAAGDEKEIVCESITEGEIAAFEGAWMVGDVKAEITVSQAGDVLSKESSLKLEQLPKALRPMAAEFAGTDELKLEKKTVVLYEVEVVRDGKTIEKLVDATGREVKVVFDDDGDDDDGDK